MTLRSAYLRVRAAYLSRMGEALSRYLRAHALVLSGPFRGLHYIQQSFFSALTPKLLGTYERELERSICKIIAAKPPKILIVGAAEGYYAVGLAFRLPESTVVAFESDETARSMLLELAKRNGVEQQIEIRAACTEPEIYTLLCDEATPVVIMDIEGGERELITDRVLGEMQRGAAIVELHGEISFPGAQGIVINEESRSGRELPRNGLPTIFRFLPSHLLRHLMNEQRPEPQQWLLIGLDDRTAM